MDFRVSWLEKTASTQSELIALSQREQLSEGCVLAAVEQSAGVGQGSNKWESQKGENLVFSLFLRPSFLHPARQFDLMQAVSLAIADFVQGFVKRDVWIKWPNDIYIGKDKLCGFLLQNNIVAERLDSSVCGIGLNVNQTKFLFAPNPTSLSLHTGKRYELAPLLDLLLEKIDLRYAQLKAGDMEAIRLQYADKLLYRGIDALYIYKGVEICATINGVNCYGHLILQARDGKEICADLKELVFTHRLP